MNGISGIQEHVHEHFCDSEESGSINDFSVTFIDKTNPTNLIQGKNCWKHTFQTSVPYSLNIKENV